MSNPSSLDYLFEDEDNLATTTATITATFPFSSLPPELRNEIYTHYFATHRTLKISSTGDPCYPPLVHTTRQIRSETQSYVTSLLTIPTIPLHAQISNYDAKPLLNTLARLSAELGVPRGELVRRVRVCFVGELDLGNVLGWVRGSMGEGEAVPVFEPIDAAVFDGYGCVGMFRGVTSLRVFVELYECFKGCKEARARWRTMALRFLENVEELGVDRCVAPSRNLSEEGLASLVFEVVARLHHMVVKLGVERKGVGMMSLAGKRKRDRTSVLFDAVELMYSFEIEARRELGLWGHRWLGAASLILS